MNKLWCVLTAGLILVVVFLASRLNEAERKLAARDSRPAAAEGRSLPARDLVKRSTAGFAAPPPSAKATKVNERPEAVAGYEPIEPGGLSTPPPVIDVVPASQGAGTRARASLPGPQISTAFILQDPAPVGHWQGGAKRNWGHEQAAGEPDTLQPGDIQTAWASKSPDGGEEWIQLDYDRAVDLKQINVVESHNPGAISKVVAVLPDGSESPVWEGSMDPSAQNELVSSDFQVPGRIRARSVKVYLDTSRVPGWNEIDAVQIVGHDGSKQWASGSRASSSYPDR